MIAQLLNHGDVHSLVDSAQWVLYAAAFYIGMKGLHLFFGGGDD